MVGDETISDAPENYGSKGQVWHPDFVTYMKAMVTHPVYASMPDAIKEDGKIQWEAPSNRKGGKYQDTHHRRRDWWYSKALTIGVDMSAKTWISETAKRIHPSGEKPCKRCGRVMRLAYVYPNGHLYLRLSKAFGKDFEYDPLEPITDLVQRLVDKYGQTALNQMHYLLATKKVEVPELGTALDEWLAWLEDVYIPSEPSLLSPGAMSNAPDRFDGFHSFNLCCRGIADTGRHTPNMRSYTTDRRVFEYWSEGDWIAADRLMGLIAARFGHELCADGGEGPPTADHIGPLSLGFTHRTEFCLLSKAANSAKNNRMTMWDVQHLLAAEQNGEQVVSWYAKPLWDLRKNAVTSEETALRFSKMLRDQQRNAMCVLGCLLDQGFFTFLATLLELHHADSDMEFQELRIRDYLTVFRQITRTPRLTKYAVQQKARRIRIGFAALHSYRSRENRHRFEISSPQIEECLFRASAVLRQAPNEIRSMDNELGSILNAQSEVSEHALRSISPRIPTSQIQCFSDARCAMSSAMTSIAVVLSGMWNTDRYVRATTDSDLG